MLAELAVNDAAVFATLVQAAKKALPKDAAKAVAAQAPAAEAESKEKAAAAAE
jgi:hypothetical protein